MSMTGKYGNGMRWLRGSLATLTSVGCLTVIVASLLHVRSGTLCVERAAAARGEAVAGCIHDFPSAGEVSKWSVRQQEQYQAAVTDAAEQTYYGWLIAVTALILGGISGAGLVALSRASRSIPDTTSGA